MGRYDREFYDRTWQGEDYTSEQQLVRTIAELAAAEVPSGRHLDVGCGNGVVMKALRNDHPGVSSVGTDFSLAALGQMRQASVCLADARRLPFPSNTFDLVTACEVLEHILEFDAALDEMVRVCKPRGVLVLSVPNFVGLSHRISMLLGNYPDRWEHLHPFTHEKFRRDLQARGLEVCKLVGDFLRIPVLVPIPRLGLRRRVNWRLRAGTRLFPHLSAHVVAVCRKRSPTSSSRGG